MNDRIDPAIEPAAFAIEPGSVRARVSAEEWAVRIDLAACYRCAALYRMTDLIYTHISARVPGPDEHFLINAFGLTWDEITASSLVKVNLDGKIIDDPTGLGINRAGYVIHSAVHRARPDVACVMHTHTAAGIAVSAQEHGLLPISQHAMRFHGALAYHDYEGVALDLDEQQRLVLDLMYYLERACTAQVDALAGGSKLRIPSPLVAAKVAAQFANLPYKKKQTEWRALRRALDRSDPSYRD
jgi:ribulose-5-phosphate 4-epimerase/fuculose-1-phosphate aldolase